MKVVLIGGGSWGTALATVLASKHIPVTLLIRDSSLAEAITKTHKNTTYSPSYTLSEYITATTIPEEAFHGATVCIYASSFQHARSILPLYAQYINEEIYFINASKGIEEQSLETMSSIIAKVLPQCLKSYSVLSGPSFAKDVLDKKYTAIVLASAEEKTSIAMQNLLSTPYFRVYHSTDIIGVELAGATKNIIAIATGIADIVQNSYNTRAAIITRGLSEIARLGIHLGGTQETFMGLAGMGDLVLTCTGELSRNRHVGTELGKGKHIDTILNEMSVVAEGVYTVTAVHTLAKNHGIYMPITEAVYSLLHNSYTVEEIQNILLNKELKPEFYSKI